MGVMMVKSTEKGREKQDEPAEDYDSLRELKKND
jgi:hypothetical protein